MNRPTTTSAFILRKVCTCSARHSGFQLQASSAIREARMQNADLSEIKVRRRRSYKKKQARQSGACQRESLSSRYGHGFMRAVGSDGKALSAFGFCLLHPAGGDPGVLSIL